MIKRLFISIVFVLFLSGQAWAALSATIASGLVDWTFTVVSGVVYAGDYVTGAAGKHGIVVRKGGGKLTIAELDGALTAGENVTADGSGAVARVNARTSPTSFTNVPNRVVFVTGDGSATTNGFKALADLLDPSNANANGVTRPSYASQWLAFDAGIHIGRMGQTAAVVFVSQNEFVDFETPGDKGYVYVSGAAGNTTTFRLGTAHYTGSGLTPFPPLYCGNGSRLRLNGTGTAIGDSLTTTTNVVFEGYDSTVTTFASKGFTLQLAGLIYWNRFVFENSSAYSTIIGSYYWNDVYIQNLTGAYFAICTGTPLYAAGLKFRNNASGSYYAWQTESENTFIDFTNYDANGVANLQTFANGGLGESSNINHYVNSETDEDSISATYAWDIENLYENSFKLTVVDDKGTAIQGAAITLVNDHGGNALWTKATATLNDYPESDTTDFALTSNSEIADNGATPSVIRIGCETMLANKKAASGTNIIATRGQYGSTAYYHYYATAKLYISAPATTDSNGKINFDGTGNYMAVPHNTAYTLFYGGAPTVISHSTTTYTLIIRKSGYKTYRGPLTISGKNGKELEITLERSPYANMSVVY